jgi:hypothetical protein
MDRGHGEADHHRDDPEQNDSKKNAAVVSGWSC